jgi:hypothetical protein
VTLLVILALLGLMLERVIYYTLNDNGVIEDENIVEKIQRWIVVHLAYEMCDYKLREIANCSRLKRIGSIPTTVAKLNTRMGTDTELARAAKKIKSEYDT